MFSLSPMVKHFCYSMEKGGNIFAEEHHLGSNLSCLEKINVPWTSTIFLFPRKFHTFGSVFTEQIVGPHEAILTKDLRTVLFFFFGAVFCVRENITTGEFTTNLLYSLI